MQAELADTLGLRAWVSIIGTVARGTATRAAGERDACVVSSADRLCADVGIGWAIGVDVAAGWDIDE